MAKKNSKSFNHHTIRGRILNVLEGDLGSVGTSPAVRSLLRAIHEAEPSPAMMDLLLEALTLNEEAQDEASAHLRTILGDA